MTNTYNKRYKLFDIEYFKDGFLKGYAVAFVTFHHNSGDATAQKETTHDILYRYIDDLYSEMGNKIVCVDYEKEIPFDNETLEEIREELRLYCEEYVGELSK